MDRNSLSKARKLPRSAYVVIALVAGVIGIVSLYLLGRTYLGGRNKMVISYLRNPEKYPDYEVEALTQCADAPFLM